MNDQPTATPNTDAAAFYVSVPDDDYGTVRQCVVDREFARAQERRITELEDMLRRCDLWLGVADGGKKMLEAVRSVLMP